jgi:peroxiredoxin
MRNRKGLNLFFILLFLLCSVGCRKEPLVKIGELASDFTLPTQEGQEITLSQYRGKNVLLFFWTQGCVFCQTRSVLLVNHVFRKGQQSGLFVLSINIAEGKGDVARFVQEKGLIYPVLMDRDGSVSRNKFGVYVVPTFFIIDRDGLIKKRLYGHVTGKDLLDFVEPYLRKKD